MPKQKRNSGSPPGAARTSKQKNHPEDVTDVLVRERRAYLEQIRQMERENQSLGRHAQALEREREQLIQRLAEGAGAQRLLPARGRRALKKARNMADRFLQTVLTNSKDAVRPLFDTFKRAEHRLMGPLDGALDHPAREQQVGTSLHVAGWATSPTTQVASVEVLLDQHSLGQAKYGIPRPDVLAARPWSTKVAECGFAGTFGINPDWIPAGAYTLRVRILDDQGHVKELTRPVTLTVQRNVYPTLQADYYHAWITRNEPDATGLATQREEQARFKKRPLISILTPVYGPPVDVLKAMIRSVQAQTYPNWELCLVDGNSPQFEVRELLQELAAQDERLHVQLLDRNLGISTNSNEALAMARGEFIALLDHDDLLAPFALYEVVKHLNEAPETDMLYSDEDRVDMNGTRHTCFFKPDWSPDLLQSFMYTGHLTVYRRSLVEELGGFRSEFDLSQDYDLALRVSERTQAIAHLPKVLYHWRTLPGSGAAGDKPHARRTNIAALDDAMKRRGYTAEVLAEPSSNRVKFKAPPGAVASIIIPSDNPHHIHSCVDSVLRTTDYPHYELLIVTHSKFIDELQRQYASEPRVRTVTYDEPFNFSLKCNRGVEQARGDFVLFLNDDARPLDAGWLECLLGYFQQEDVGAVAPKLVYVNNTLQHAGMVTGVRNLVGTAFHTLPQDTTLYFNMAQSTRTVSALSAACMLMRKQVFEKIGGFDAVNTPIMHSDMDLCFKIREAGLRLVYTPFTTLEHVGHVSLGDMERKGHSKHSEKSDIFLLKRWSEYCAYDPYFPDHMREFLYFDSPVPFRMQAGGRCEDKALRHDILVATHDLSQSGAPIILQALAGYLRRENFVTVMSPSGGRLLQEYAAQQIPVIVDQLIMEAPEHLEKFISEFDVVVANTILHWRLVLTAKQLGKPVVWFIHEAAGGLQQAMSNPQIARALKVADQVIFPGQMVATLYKQFSANGNHRALFYGMPERETKRRVLPQAPDRVRIMHMGSIEPRKGQDVLIQAIKKLGKEREGFEFYFVGRVLHRGYYLEQLEATMNMSNVHWLGEIPFEEVLDYLVTGDALACTSRDECLPLVVVDALAQRRPVLTTAVGLLPEIIKDSVNGFLVESEDAEGVAKALLKLKDKALRGQIAEAGRATYEQHLGYERYGREVLKSIDALLLKKRQGAMRAARG